jgi:hypothetical protein
METIKRVVKKIKLGCQSCKDTDENFLYYKNMTQEQKESIILWTPEKYKMQLEAIVEKIDKSIRIVDVFAGTCILPNMLREAGYEVLTNDLDPLWSDRVDLQMDFRDVPVTDTDLILLDFPIKAQLDEFVSRQDIIDYINKHNKNKFLILAGKKENLKWIKV